MNSTPTGFNKLALLQYVVLGCVILYFGAPVFIPLAYAVFISFSLYPITRWLEKHRFRSGMAIFLSLMVLFVIIGSIVGLLVNQAIGFVGEWGSIQGKLASGMNKSTVYLHDHYGLTTVQIDKWVENAVMKLGNELVSVVSSTIYMSALSAIKLFLIPVYTALILYNRKQLVKALFHFFPNETQESIISILHEVVFTFYRFIKGMIIVYLIVGTLNSIGLYLLGVPNPILFGFITSILTFIPYIGIFIGAALPVSIAWAMHDNFWYALGVIGVFAFVQILEGNVIFPLAVSIRIKVSTLFTVLAIFVGGLLWGLSGMILFIPAVGILKQILGRTNRYKYLAEMLEG